MAGIDGGAIWELADALKAIVKTESSVQLKATVSGIDEDGTIWVQVEGSDESTPVNGDAYASVVPGDMVTVGIDNGVMNLSGNGSDPSVGASYVEETVAPVAADARAASLAADIAKSAAEAAQAVAEAVGQHFWHADDGAHVTQVTQDEWNDQSGEGYHSGPNSLWNSLGMLFRDGLNNLLALVTGSNPGVAIYDGLGNAASNITALFTGDGVVLGKSGEARVSIDSGGFDLVNKDGDTAMSMRTNMALYTLVYYTYDVRTYVESMSELPYVLPEWLGANYLHVQVDVYAEGGGLIPAVEPDISYIDLEQVEEFAEEAATDVGKNVWWHIEGTNLVIDDVPDSKRAEIEAGLADGEELWLRLRHVSATVGASALTIGTRIRKYPAVPPAPNSATFGENLIGSVPNSVTVGRYDGSVVPAQKDDGIPMFKVGNGTGEYAQKTVWYADDHGHMFAAGGATLQSPNLTRGTAVSAGTEGTSYLMFNDSDGKAVGRVGPYFNTSNREGVRFGTTRTVSGSSVAHWLYMYIDAGGNRTVAVSSGVGPAWRNAIGASNGIWPIDEGGTGQSAVTTTTTVNDIISAQTGATVSSASFAQWGKLAMVTVAYTLNSAVSVPTTGNTTNTALFTLASGKRPAVGLNAALDNGDFAMLGDIGTGGVVTLRGANARSAAYSLDTSTTRYMRVTYLLA